jgi:peptide/nickel transport system substrate-binding protein
MSRRAAASALACAALVLAACGGGDGGAESAGGSEPPEGGSLHYALAADPVELDPLFATDRASQVVTRQIHEPLAERLTGPFGDLRELPGLARSASPSSDATIWRFRLRPRIRFGDGTPFNAAAVLANADRWLATDEGRALLPGLAAVDAPKPDLVRFILDVPDPGLFGRLAQARLGLVSPRALREAGTGAVDVGAGGTGTGAFELREQEAGATTVIARNVDWWGTRLELGPALDQVVFRVVPDPAERVAALADDQVEIADDLDPASAAEVRDDPLLTVDAGGGGAVLGVERSVRGLELDAGVPQLSGAWLTTVGVGE